MDSEEFIIPVKRKDLLNRTTMTQYVVEELLTLRQVPAAIHEIKQAVRLQSPTVIREQFNSLFSIVCLQRDLNPGQKEVSWELLMKAFTTFHNCLGTALQSDASFADQRPLWLKLTKMATYLVCQYVEMLESDAREPDATQLAKVKGRGKAKKSTVDTGLDWSSERRRAVEALHRLVQLPLAKLWSPPVPEEDFVNMVTTACYGLLENPDVTRDKETRDLIFHLLGVAIKGYNHSLVASLHIPQLLQHFEHLATPLVQAALLFAQEFGMKSVVTKIVREIASIECEDMTKNTTGTRTCAAFLVELSEVLPSLMLSSLCVLVNHLEGESYQMRNCVLSVMAEIIVRVLSHHDLTPQQKVTRDEMLEKFEDHIHDVTAFVRSKVLQLWLYIINKECLPLVRQERVVELVIGRLRDKSSQVRKNAVQLLSALVKCNPYAAKLSVQDLTTSYETEKAKLDTMVPPADPTPRNCEQMDTWSAEWTVIETGLNEYLVKLAAGDGFDSTVFGDSRLVLDAAEIRDEETPQDVFARLCDLLINKHFTSALAVLESLKDTYPDLHCFHQPDADPGDDADPEDDTINDSERPDNRLAVLRAIFIDHKSGGAPVVDNALPPESDDVLKQRLVVRYLQDTLSFATQVQHSFPAMCQLLASRTASDTLEAIEFFATCYEFGVANAGVGIRRMLPLVWSSEPAVRDTVVAAYKRVYLSPPAGSPRNAAVSIVTNLTSLIYGCTYGDMTSLEALVGELYKSGDLDANVVHILWERFTLKIADTTPQESRAALVILAMLAGAEPEIVRSNIDLLVGEAMGARATTDLGLCKEACVALQKLASKKKLKADVDSEPFRFHESHEIFTRLADILVSTLTNVADTQWIPLAEQAINVIYKLAEHPDRTCGNLLKTLAKKVYVDSGLQQTVETTRADEESQKTAEEGEDDCALSTRPTLDGALPNTTPPQLCEAAILCRVITVTGHVAFRQLVHLDAAVFSELKRRRVTNDADKSRGDASKDESRPKPGENVENVEDEMGLSGAGTEDAESEFIRKICDSDIVAGANLLALFAPLIVAICSDTTRYRDAALRTAAALALSKFMLVSSPFCDAQLQLLFTMLEKSRHAVIRANTIVALGDLTVRFPNLVEPWSPKLYARLRDESLDVRKNTLHVLAHLILNDMVKVKGHISELATCIVDANPQISGLSKLFFGELAKKGNAIYNVMPDIISRLSDVEVGVDEERFRAIMKYLFSFIQKDRQCESLVEKLCQRYRVTNTTRQWRDLSFCLSLLSYSPKAIGKLNENFAFFADKITDDDVFTCFMAIIANAKKGIVKPELKTAVDELEQRLTRCHARGLGEADDEDTDSTTRDAKTPRKSTRPTNKNARRVRKTVSDSDQDDADDVSATQAPVRSRPRRQTKRIAFVDSSDEDDDTPFSPSNEPMTGNRGNRPPLVTGRRFIDSDDSNEDADPGNSCSDDDKENNTSINQGNVPQNTRTDTRRRTKILSNILSPVS